MSKVNGEWETELRKRWYLWNKTKDGAYTTCGEEIIDFISQIESQTRDDLLREIMEEMPKKIDCDETTGEMPTDPGLSADQARNFTIDQVNTLLERKLSTVKK